MPSGIALVFGCGYRLCGATNLERKFRKMRAILLVGALVLAGCQSAAGARPRQPASSEVHNASMKEVSGLSKAAHSRR